MLILLVSLVVLGIVAAVATKMLMRGDGVDTAAPVNAGSDCGTCNGDNDKCEQTCMMEAAVKPVEYYDDEELDQYRGRPSDDYTDDEAEQFRDILYTMRQDEVAGWNRSLILRGINLPNQVKDEVVMLIGE
ncbi:MAG: hypothetical protein J6C10_04755 [Prevotella sp.]|nr:hypothetical protein [Prevotella sp.]MBO5058792.1 hypothetical protein [Prevotella sp.]MBO5204537.1 hypothetical protein [Prevotella sp.]